MTLGIFAEFDQHRGLEGQVYQLEVMTSNAEARGEPSPEFDVLGNKILVEVSRFLLQSPSERKPKDGKMKQGREEIVVRKKKMTSNAPTSTTFGANKFQKRIGMLRDQFPMSEKKNNKTITIFIAM